MQASITWQCFTSLFTKDLITEYKNNDVNLGKHMYDVKLLNFNKYGFKKKIIMQVSKSDKSVM